MVQHSTSAKCITKLHIIGTIQYHSFNHSIKKTMMKSSGVDSLVTTHCGAAAAIMTKTMAWLNTKSMVIATTMLKGW